MSDTFHLSPCCGNENYKLVVQWAPDKALYECKDCGRVFHYWEVVVQHVEYGLEEEIERAAGMMEGLTL